MKRFSKHAYLRAAMKAAGIQRLHLGGFWPKTEEQDEKITIVVAMLKGMGFERIEGSKGGEYVYTKGDESITVNNLAGRDGLRAFWLNTVT
jgi:hypothetical protein